MNHCSSQSVLSFGVGPETYGETYELKNIKLFSNLTVLVVDF